MIESSDINMRLLLYLWENLGMILLLCGAFKRSWNIFKD